MTSTDEHQKTKAALVKEIKNFVSNIGASLSYDRDVE